MESNYSKGWKMYGAGKTLLFSKTSNTKEMSDALVLFDKAIEYGVQEAYGDRAFCLQGLEYHFNAIFDFDVAILSDKIDANLYYGRSHSKMIIMDYDGSIEDMKTAIELSKVKNKLNIEYDDEIKKTGWKSATSFYTFKLQEVLDRKESTKNEIIKEIHSLKVQKIKRR